MIKTLEIKNFKSIKHLKLDCKRVNIFIGKPNTGKSNILESVGIFSLPYVHDKLNEIARFENMTNLFYDQDVSEKIEIAADDISCEVSFENGKFKIIEKNKDGSFKHIFNSGYDGKGNVIEAKGDYRILPVKFYRFAIMEKFTRLDSDFLMPPKGDNLLQILITKKEMRKVVSNLFSEYGLKIVLKPQEYKIEVQKEIEDVIIAYPYSLVSDTLQRVVFYLAAIETNNDSIIILEEPEAHAFPFYTKFLAERIALDDSNQYFISTHNPYFLLSVLEKTPKQDFGIFITYFQDYQTKVKTLTEKEMPEILDLDASIFFNLNRFVGEK